MSSVLKHFSQIPVRTKFFLSTDSTTVYIPNAAWPAVSSVLDETAFADGTSNDTGVIEGAGVLLKDLGRQAYVYDSVVPGAPTGNNLVAIYREVQLVSGADTEGVSGTEANGYGSFYVKVWDAAGSGVVVVRTG